MTTLALDVEGLCVRYGAATAVRDVTLAIEAGQTCAIVGPNGAGKTSLLLGIQGIVRATTSKLMLGSRKLDRLGSVARTRAGLVLIPQGREIFPSLSVRTNLQVVADSLHLPSEAVDNALDRFPILRERAQQPAGVLSGGEQKILAIARALMTSPSVLLLDEPTEGLAPKIVGAVTSALERIQAQGATIIITEPTTRTLPERISLGLVMIRGAMVASATSRDGLRTAFQEHYGT